MDKPRRTLFSASTLQDLLLPMVTITFGLQMFRILFPSLVWYLKDTVGVGSASSASTPLPQSWSASWPPLSGGWPAPGWPCG